MGGGEPPTCTASKSERAFYQSASKQFDIVVNRRESHRNVFQRVCSALYRVFVAHNRQKWSSNSEGPEGLMMAGMTFAPDSLRNGQDSDGGEGRQCPSPLYSRNLRATHCSKVSGLDFGALSCFVGQTLALDASKGNLSAALIVDAKLGAGILPEVELGQITIKMLGIDVLIDADDAPLEDPEEPFKGVSVNVAARPLILGVVDRFMLAGPELVVCAFGHEAAIFVQILQKAARCPGGRGTWSGSGHRARSG